MRYIDSGSSDPSQAVGAWLREELTPHVTELRWQTGFFASQALGFFATSLQALAGSDRLTRVVIGSNEPGTLGSDVRHLVDLMGLPREHANLGIVNYGNAYYHPKTYHVTRDDGTQCAYVGSANLTPPALTGSHVEAGLILDTRKGDPQHILDQIAEAVDEWFVETTRVGFHRVSDGTDVERMVGSGLLLAVPVPRPTNATTAGAGPSGTPRSRRGPLIGLPSITWGVPKAPPRRWFFLSNL